jgi:hypothetical protein
MVWGRGGSRLRAATCAVFGSEIGKMVSVEASLEAPVRFLNENDAGKIENLLGFSCFDISLSFRRSLFFRPKPNDEDLRDSID